MLRLVLGILAGLLVGVLVIFAVESVGHMLFPPPDGTNLTDPQAMRQVMMVIPWQAKAMVLIAWFLGILAGASTACLIAGRRALAGRITAALLFAFAVWTMISIPHPAWFVVAAVIATLVAALLADRAFGRVRA